MASIEPSVFQNQKLDVSTLPKFEEVPLRRLSPKYLWKMNISTTVFMLIVLGIVAGAYFSVPEYRLYLPIALALVVLIFGWNYFTNFQLQKRNGYALRERDIIFHRGFLFQKTTVVPFNRVQHVSTNRGVLDKIFKLSTLKVFTAGGSGSDVSIPALVPETAETLKQALADRMSGHV